MALIEPNSRIDFLRGIPFDPSYENTMYFDNINQQVSYFDTKIAITLEDASYQRVDSGYMKVGWVEDTYGRSVINQMYNVNYMRFKNTNFENKWFYAFVDNIQYINNNTVGVYYHLDVMQTWHFEYSFNECFIERQHTETDAIGSNTIPEDLELGDYVFGQPYEFTYTPRAIVVTAGLLDGTYTGGTVISGLTSMGDTFSGVHYYTFDISTQTGLDNLNSLLETAYTSREKQNTIISIFMYSSYFMQGNKVPLETTVYLPASGNDYMIDNHVVRNKKLLTYPYNLIYVSNYQGNHAEYKYEYFSNPSQCKVKVWGSIGTNPGMVLYPHNYKTSGDNFDEAITLNGFPMCAWVNDAYKAWVAQNAGTINATIFAAGVSWGDTLIKGKNYIDGANNTKGISNFVNGMANYLNVKNKDSLMSKMISAQNQDLKDFSQSLGRSLIATAGIIGKMRDHAVQPPQAHGNTNGDVLYQSGKMTFMIVNKHIRTEYADIIDSFFDMYGYAIHKCGIPNRNARPCYTYVKTVGCSLDGNVPVSDLKMIEDIFNSGIRFWRTNATFGKFERSYNDNSPSI